MTDLLVFCRPCLPLSKYLSLVHSMHAVCLLLIMVVVVLLFAVNFGGAFVWTCQFKWFTQNGHCQCFCAFLSSAFSQMSIQKRSLTPMAVSSCEFDFFSDNFCPTISTLMFDLGGLFGVLGLVERLLFFLSLSLSCCAQRRVFETKHVGQKCEISALFARSRYWRDNKQFSMF